MLLGPIIRPLLRPIFVEIIKVSITTSEEVRRMSVQVREDIEDAAAEVNAERASKKAAESVRPPAPPSDGGAPPPPESN